MCAHYYLGAVVAVGMICGSGIDVPGSVGIGTAWAKAGKTGIHTRKRVGGRWVTGRFANKGGHSVPGLDHPRVPERLASLQLPATNQVAEQIAETQDEHRARLQKALEARAQEIAITRLDTPDPVAAAPSALSDKAVVPASAQPRSVSFDFESGLKTTTFPGDRLVREGFDVAAAKSLASAPLAEPGLLRPKP